MVHPTKPIDHRTLEVLESRLWESITLMRPCQHRFLFVYHLMMNRKMKK